LERSILSTCVSGCLRARAIFQAIKAKATGKTAAPIEPPTLVCVDRLAYGPFRFRTQIPKELEYEIEATSNLKNWIFIASETSNGEIEFVDSDAPKFSYRFYRLNVNGVYSTNIIGYATVTLPPGFSVVANPLSGADESVPALFKGVPDGTALSKFDSRIHRLTENAFEAGKWTNPTEKLSLGEGALLFNPTSEYKKLRFVGSVSQNSLTTPIPAGFSMRGSAFPQPGRLDTDLGFPISDGDVIHLMDGDRQKYLIYPYKGSAWAGEPPVLGVGEAFWVAKEAAGTWLQEFTMIPPISQPAPPEGEIKQPPDKKNIQ
jgi:hypothetical protein